MATGVLGFPATRHLTLRRAHESYRRHMARQQQTYGENSRENPDQASPSLRRTRDPAKSTAATSSHVTRIHAMVSR
jgi:hypothetical protein